MRPATQLVRLAQEFRSAIRLAYQGKIADARSIVSVLLLCAAARTTLDLEIAGDDEDLAMQEVESLFQSSNTDSDVASTSTVKST